VLDKLVKGTIKAGKGTIKGTIKTGKGTIKSAIEIGDGDMKNRVKALAAIADHPEWSIRGCGVAGVTVNNEMVFIP
jgi:hypothetical protein